MALAITLGALVGLIMGLTEAGGGILAVPLLVSGLQLIVAQAAPIGLLAVGIAAAMGAIIGLKSKLIRYRAALLIAATGVLLAPVGVWLAQQLDTRVLSAMFAIVLVWVAYKNLKESRQGGQEITLVPNRHALGTRRVAASSGTRSALADCLWQEVLLAYYPDCSAWEEGLSWCPSCSAIPT